MKRKAAFLVILLLLGVAAALGFFWPFGDGSGTLRLHGIVEIQEVRLASKVGGRIAKVLVQEGDEVQPNQLLAVLDEKEKMEAQVEKLEAQKNEAEIYVQQLGKSLPLEIEAAKAAMEVAELRWKRTKEGWRKEEIDIAQKELNAAYADLEYARKEHKRVSDLVEKNSASEGEKDLAYANKERAESKYLAADSKLAMVESGGWIREQGIALKELDQAKANYQKISETRYEVEAQALAKVRAIDADLKKARIDLKETEIRAPARAIVEVVAVRAGDVVAPNQPIIRVLNAADLWVKVFVPETELGKLRLKQKVDVRCDAYPGKNFQGEVVQVGSIAEFTPRNVQSKEERRFQVFPVKIRVSDPQGVFKAGMAAEVLVPVTAMP